MVAAAPAAQRGAAMAVHTFLGFGAGFLSPMVFGATLDAAGGGWGSARLKPVASFFPPSSACLFPPSARREPLHRILEMRAVQ
jgi:hypothetical protein